MTLPEDTEPTDLPVTDDESQIFDWRTTTKGTLSDAFRIFTSDERSNEIPTQNAWNQNETRNQVEVYTDGSCINNGDDNATAGAGIFSKDDPTLTCAIRIPSTLKQTNQTGEIIGLKQAAEKAHLKDEVTFCSDSKTALDGLTTLREKWENIGYIGIENAREFQVTTARLRARKALSIMKKVKAHVGIEGNEEADKLANEGRTKPNEDRIDLTIPRHLCLTGAKLKCLNQSLVYQAIKQRKMEKPKHREKLNRRSTQQNIGMAKIGAIRLSGKTPSDKRIWRAMRHRDFSRQFRYFSWMTAHNGYMVGKFWDRTQEPWKGVCAFCKVEESMEHILTECRGPGMEEIWSLCEDLWRGKRTEWLRPSFGEILSCGLVELKDNDGNPKKGDSRVYRIIVSESAHLIWKLRNARVINGKGFPSAQEILNKWNNCINSRLQIDCLLANSRFGSKRLSQTIVEKTWYEVLQDKESLPDVWTKSTGVLVSNRAGVG
ncbi:ribonuclease H-like protein [Lentinula edodes]|nr:ribonuclease H-like protein [Lentinula edodes]